MADNTEEINIKVKSDIGKVAEDTEKLESGLKKAKGGVKSLSIGFKTLAKASGIVFLLNKAFEIFQEILGKNQKVMDFMKTTTTSLSIAFNDLFGFISNNVGKIVGWFKSIFDDPAQSIKDFGKAIQDNLIERFDSLLETFGHLGKAIGHLFKGEFKEAFDSAKDAGKEYVDVLTGVDDSVDRLTTTVKNGTTAVIDYTKSTIDQAKGITATEKAANRAAVVFAKLNAEFLKDAEIQRQIRDDETKTFADRIEANNKLSEILEKQQKLQKEQIQTQINYAQSQYDINASEENWIALEEAKVSMLELEETITGQLSEQKTNAVALDKELLESQNEIRAEGLTGIQRELEELEASYKLKLDMARKSGMDTTAITKQFEAQKSQIVASGVNAQLGAYSALTGALGKLAGENKEMAIAQAIIDTYAAANAVLKDPTLVGPMRWISAAAVIATGLANVQQIMQTEVPGGGGGGSVPTANAETPAPEMLSGQFTLGSGQQPEPIQAYVVSDDITNNQDKLAAIRRRATI
jgi:hypothetical protein